MCVRAPSGGGDGGRRRREEAEWRTVGRVGRVGRVSGMLEEPEEDCKRTGIRAGGKVEVEIGVARSVE